MCDFGSALDQVCQIHPVHVVSMQSGPETMLALIFHISAHLPFLHYTKIIPSTIKNLICKQPNTTDRIKIVRILVALGTAMCQW